MRLSRKVKPAKPAEPVLATFEDTLEVPAVIPESAVALKEDGSPVDRKSFNRAFRHTYAKKGFDAVEDVVTVVKSSLTAVNRDMMPDHKVRLSGAQLLIEAMGAGGKDAESQAVSATFNQMNIIASGKPAESAVEDFFRHVKARQSGVDPELITSVPIPDLDEPEEGYEADIVVQEALNAY